MIIYTIPANWNWNGKCPRASYVLTHKWGDYLADLDRLAIRRQYRRLRRAGVNAYGARDVIVEMLRLGVSRIESIEYVAIEVNQ
jgi:hypothetical protein